MPSGMTYPYVHPSCSTSCARISSVVGKRKGLGDLSVGYQCWSLADLIHSELIVWVLYCNRSRGNILEDWICPTLKWMSDTDATSATGNFSIMTYENPKGMSRQGFRNLLSSNGIKNLFKSRKLLTTLMFSETWRFCLSWRNLFDAAGIDYSFINSQLTLGIKGCDGYHVNIRFQIAQRIFIKLVDRIFLWISLNLRQDNTFINNELLVKSKWPVYWVAVLSNLYVAAIKSGKCYKGDLLS